MAKTVKTPVKKDPAITLPTLEEDVQMKIDTLKGGGLDSNTGREIALKNILEDVAGGHVDTELEGTELIREVKDQLGIK